MFPSGLPALLPRQSTRSSKPPAQSAHGVPSDTSAADSRLGRTPRQCLPVGTKLSIELKQGESVTGTARWIEQETVGVGFDEPIDIVSLISVRAEGPRPRIPRIEVDCTATVRDGATVIRAKAVNISQGGIGVESSNELAVRADVIVSLSGFAPEPAVVKWRDGDSYGLAFNRVLSITQLVAWLQVQRERLSAVG